MAFSRATVLLLILYSFTAFAHAHSPQQERPARGVLISPPCSIRGHVRYAQNYEPVPRVSVKLQAITGLGHQTRTDARGQFEFGGLSPAPYTLEVVEDGYKAVRRRVDLQYWSCHEYTTILLEPKTPDTSKPSGDTVGVRELAIPGKARKAFAKGIRELYEKKRPDRSLRHFRKAIELYADYEEAYVQLSLAHFQQADYAQAQHVLETGLAVNPGNTRAYVVLGLVYKQQRQAQRAIQAWKRAVKLDENAWRAHFELGKTFLVAGNIEEAQKHAQRAHQLKPQAPSVHLLVYNLCLLQDDREAALAELDEFLALHPQNPWAPQLRQRRIILRQSLGFSP